MKYIAITLMIFVMQSHADVDLVKVLKTERKMYLLDGGETIAEFDIALGGEPVGHKEREGDQRTPEGEYVLDYKKEDSTFYRAMHIDYPNSTDIKTAQDLGVSPGGLIMVHGQRNGLGWFAWITQNFDWTDGCIALTNSQMDTFMELVSAGTKIHIEQ
tara:strand:+ start:113 stop:586 length:474 start_codon:yes stop_codon:yes gene_type:complete